MKICCETGEPVNENCFHDHCNGPLKKINPGWHYAARKVPDELEETGYIYELVEVFPSLGAHTENAVTVCAESREELARWLRIAADDVMKWDVVE